MKMFLMSSCVLVLVGLTGCSDPTPDGAESARPASERTAEPAPRGADQEVAAESVAGEADQTFSLSVPFEAIALTQGEEISMRIGINRGENFGEKVEINVSGLPSGVAVETEEATITPGSTGVDLTLKAADDAALGDFTAEITGQTDSSGADFSKEIKLTVSQK